AGRGLARGLEPRARPRVKARERITPHGDDATSAAPSAHRSEDNKRGPRCGPLSMRCLELRGPHGSVHMSLPSPPNAARKPQSEMSSISKVLPQAPTSVGVDRKSTRLNSSHVKISYAVFCLKKKIS